MREEIRAAIATGVPALGGRVLEEGKVLPTEVKPFAIVQKGVADAGSPFSAYSTPVDVFVEHDQTTFGAIDAILEDIIALLDRKTLVEVETGRRHMILYQGSVAPDTIDEERDPGVDIRGLRFVTLSLAWHSGLTFDPDPTTGLAAYLRDRFSERQVLTITGGPTGGSYTITHPGPPSPQTTTALPINATAAQIEAALELLSNIGVGNVLVEAQGAGIAGIATTPVVFRFRGALANKAVPQMTVQPSLTGGSSPAATLTTLSNGAEVQTDPATWNPDDDSPGVYFRVASVDRSETHPWGSWIQGSIDVHVVAATNRTQEEWIRKLAELLSRPREVLFPEVLEVRANASGNPFIQGQIRLSCEWGTVPEVKPKSKITGVRFRFVFGNTMPEVDAQTGGILVPGA